MKVIILAAGYATRLYPLTLNQPKPLLPVAGKPMVEHVLDNLAPITEIDRIYVVTNAKFADHFQKWSEHYRATKSKFEFTIVNDHSTDDTNKLGAIGDINYVLKTQNVDDDLMVIAGDNLFSDQLGEFGKFCLAKNAPALAVYDVGNLRRSKNTIPSAPTPMAASPSSRKNQKIRRAHSPASRCIIIRKRQFRSSNNTSPRATIPTNPAGSCNGFIRARPFTPGACPACGSTSARRKLWKRRTRSLRSSIVDEYCLSHLDNDGWFL
ncbi:MAG: sugar phosphate nucleotidyltransferase [Limisphaerales bacterium]